MLKTLLDNGYEAIPCNGKVPTQSGWASVDHNLTSPPPGNWDGTNVGIRTGQGDTPIYAVDIDIYDPVVSKDILRGGLNTLGDSPIRTGMQPKAMLFYRAEAGHKKIQRKWTDSSGKIHGVEILGHGQQFIAEGIHPDTKQPYSWDRGNLHDVPAIELIEVEHDDIKVWLDSITAPDNWVEDMPSIDPSTGEMIDYSPKEYSEPYVTRAIDNELETLAGVGEGDRNNQLNKSAFILFGLLDKAGREDLEDDVRERLRATGNVLGLDANEIKATLTSAYKNRGKTTRKPPKNVTGKAKLTELNKTYSLAIIGRTAAVMHHNSNNEYDMLSVDAFKTLFCNDFMVDGPKFNPLGKSWINWGGRLTYKEGVCFEPAGTVTPHKLNLWTGFPYKPVPCDDSIELIKEYILDIVCNRNLDYYHYLIKWMARGFQHPEKLAEVAVVLRGSKGSGKGTLGKLLKKMWGIHGKHISSSKYLTGNFNGHLKNCCFMFADEAFFAGDKAGEANLKALITEPTMMIEFKGVDATESKNCLKILMASNSDWVVPSSKDERRYFCLDVDERFENDEEKEKYFTELYTAIDDEKNISMFMDFMLTLDLNGFNFRKYPETEANKAQRVESLGVIPQYLLEACEKGYLVEGWEWYPRVTPDVISVGLASWGKANFKSAYDRQGVNAIKNYLNKTLGLKSKARRSVAVMRNGWGVDIVQGVKGGYEIGTASELKNLIISIEKLPVELVENIPVDNTGMDNWLK